ncbi:DUF4012 domain-containing protein [Paramicrobacterium chengjingii]|uniref:DUF4012 domain-containing protein n=1 Tax=Paramicrobacterium chengjingii TaxID=2769067 RepID=A0ABX6YFE5_9MICO|nr:DUF4012 domain-containing protein [Microbacterium chengjingii]QPZ37497.1 DUF4012 domain-containing protein [Microbacterium chengjingii]
MGSRAVSKPLYKRAVLWVPIICVLVLALVAVVVCGFLVAKQALAVRDSLNKALPLVSTIQEHVTSGDIEAAKSSVSDLEKYTEQARSDTGGFLWDIGEGVPVLGNNLVAVRTTAEVADSLATKVVKPLSQFSLDDLKPVDGKINVDQISALGETVTNALEATTTSQKRFDSLNRDGLVDQITSAMDKIEPKLTEVSDLLGAAKQATDVLPAALGADGPRNYLMLFQNNAEARGTGGNPASILLVNVTDGAITIADQASSRDFTNGGPELITDIDEQTLKLYGDKIGRYMMDMTLTPDFTTTADIATAWWGTYSDMKIDGVMSLDPVALSYLLKATGPIELETGDTLTSENAVSLLLNETYFRYEDPDMQDLFFAAAAGSIFDALTQGDLDIKELITQLTVVIDQGRLLYSSSDDAENALFAGTRVAGALPESNADDNVAGVYINDTTGSKMDFYMNMTIGAEQTCTADAASTAATVTLSNILDPAKADSLPDYIQGPYYKHGRIATDVVLYAPVGQTIENVTVNGKTVTPNYSGEHLGRSVAKISVTTDPGTQTVIGYTLTGGADADAAPLDFWHTPMVRETPVDVARCKA